MMRRTGIAFLWGLAAMWLVGCNKPCATTSDCNQGDVCTAAICRALSCEEAIFAKDPASGACVALSGCFLTPEQRTWQTCSEDPCAGLSELGCMADARCQPGYASPDVENPSSSSGSGGDVLFPGTSTIACGFTSTIEPGPRDASGIVPAPGVNNGSVPKHGGFVQTCLPGKSRTYAGCRAVPQIAPQRPCAELTTSQCQTRSDCSTSLGSGGGATLPPDIAVPGVPTRSLGQCFDLHARQPSCEFADALSCLTNPECQAIGARCYCPPGGQCDCSGGSFLGCEKNDRLRRCSSSAECGAGERCDNDEACIAPRTFTSTPTPPAGPGAPGCLGACVPTGCAGMGEQQCNANPSCDAGRYGTVCRPKPYCASPNGEVIFDLATDEGDGTGRSCGCDSEFIGCAPQTPLVNLNPERSLLVRDAAIIDDPTFSLQSVLTQLAPAGEVDAFVSSLISQVGSTKQVASGATTKARMGFSKFSQDLGIGTGVAGRFTKLMATTALINRLDLASAGNCGEARISFAMTSAYTNGNQRMTLIVELKVPDDGTGCKQVAQRWAELSLIDDAAERRAKLIALYSELLTPANLGQLRTNEFVNLTGGEAWELREFHINPGTGLLDLVPVAQTVDPSQAGTTALLGWVTANAASLKAGTAVIPAQFLAGASTENGARLTLDKLTTDRTELEKSVNSLACAGCHLTETKSPFVHIGERLATKVGTEYRPVGRAVIDDFLQKELPKRAALLTQVLTATQALVAADWRPRVQTRVH